MILALLHGRTISMLRRLDRIGLVVGLVLCLCLFSSNEAVAQKQPNITIKVSKNKKAYVGKPISWNGDELLMLRRDGRVSTLSVKSEKGYSKVADGFRPYTVAEVSARLRKEFGSGYQVSATQNFVVVHPRGDYSVWALPFQRLYERFKLYFTSRGFQLQQPKFPMVAVVLKSRLDFDRFLKAYHEYDRNLLGYYSKVSNRIITYDQSEGKGTRGSGWFFNADTIIHEATHQTAFNTGVHSRYAVNSRWVSEGLAMMFESPGVNNSIRYHRQSDRINRDRLIALKHYYGKDQIKGKVSSMVLRDDIFRSNPQMAYALAWGMTFFLSEKMPRQYQLFLRNDARRSDFRNHGASQRAAAFAKAFGSDIKSLEKRMKSFFSNLKVPPEKQVKF